MRYFFLLFFVSVCTFSTLAQDKLILQHSKRKRKEKELSLDKSFSFKHHKDEYTHGRVVEFTDSNLTILKYDSSRVVLDFADIEIIERDIYPNRRWLEPFGFIAIGAGLTLAATPIIWAADGGEKAIEGLEFAGILTAISAPPILIATRKERYNLLKKWYLEAR